MPLAEFIDYHNDLVFFDEVTVAAQFLAQNISARGAGRKHALDRADNNVRFSVPR